MKKHFGFTFYSLSVILLFSCMSSRTDGKRIAMEQNKAKFNRNLSRDAKFVVCAVDAAVLEIMLGN